MKLVKQHFWRHIVLRLVTWPAENKLIIRVSCGLRLFAKHYLNSLFTFPNKDFMGLGVCLYEITYISVLQHMDVIPEIRNCVSVPLSKIVRSDARIKLTWISGWNKQYMVTFPQNVEFQLNKQKVKIHFKRGTSYFGTKLVFLHLPDWLVVLLSCRTTRKQISKQRM